jgi:ABC-type glycerol-3-phosphate transport system substrate-binding protein
MINAGLVRDLTDLAESDPGFDRADFYEPIWRGVWWEERMWAMPFAGQMRLLYYDRQAFQTAARPEPSPRWTWREMEQDLTALLAVAAAVPPLPAAAWNGSYGLLDPTRDTLYSYAYHHHAQFCPEQGDCLQAIGQTEIETALAWYEEQVLTNHMAAVAGSTAAERSFIMANWQSFPRRAAIWVDDPVRYEQYLLAGSIGVVPFPGSGRTNSAYGTTPLWVHGGFISQSSPHPHAVWMWLKFLAGRPLNAPLRYVPARPSVASTTGFWEILPRPLGNTMRVAFPFARPVLISEQSLIGEEQLSAVNSQ